MAAEEKVSVRLLKHELDELAALHRGPEVRGQAGRPGHDGEMHEVRRGHRGIGQGVPHGAVLPHASC